jgi:hypothetical protein
MVFHVRWNCRYSDPPTEKPQWHRHLTASEHGLLSVSTSCAYIVVALQRSISISTTAGQTNALHGSDSPASAARELRFFFPSLRLDGTVAQDDAAKAAAQYLTGACDVY